MRVPRSLVLRARSRPLTYNLAGLEHNRLDIYDDLGDPELPVLVAKGYMDFTAYDDNFVHDTIYSQPTRYPHHLGKYANVPIEVQSCKALWITEQRGDPYKIYEQKDILQYATEKREYVINLMCLLVQRVIMRGGDYSNGGRTMWRRIGVGITEGPKKPNEFGNSTSSEAPLREEGNVETGSPDDGKWLEMEDFEII